jgi:sarcosine oxidase delta subunit
MLDFFEISCPYCGEAQDVDVDSSAGEHAYWQD